MKNKNEKETIKVGQGWRREQKTTATISCLQRHANVAVKKIHQQHAYYTHIRTINTIHEGGRSTFGVGFGMGWVIGMGLGWGGGIGSQQLTVANVSTSHARKHLVKDCS